MECVAPTPLDQAGNPDRPSADDGRQDQQREGEDVSDRPK